MKCLLLLSLFITMNVFASAMLDCDANMMKVWSQSGGYTCVPRMTKTPIEECLGPVNQTEWPFQNFPLFSKEQQPWWAVQGNLYYPNVSYPGPWAWPGIEEKYYPGEGQIFAAKPNVYVDSIHAEKKFSFKFISAEKPKFLATTPVLEKDLTWAGKIVEKDKFEVDGIYYDYLFYDVRLPKEKMQFENGLCATRENAIQWMMKDLTEMKYSSLSLQDFEEHWRVKIPDYPYYCIYPQYNRDLDPILPVEIGIDQNTFIRGLYVLVPFKKEPDVSDPQDIPLPSKDPSEYRPGARIQREVMFREWGVAFLGY